MYVTDGVVGWGPRIRLFSENAISLLTINKSAPGGRPTIPDAPSGVYFAIFSLLLFWALFVIVVMTRTPVLGWVIGSLVCYVPIHMNYFGGVDELRAVPFSSCFQYFPIQFMVVY